MWSTFHVYTHALCIMLCMSQLSDAAQTFFLFLLPEGGIFETKGGAYELTLHVCGTGGFKCPDR